MCCWCTWVDNVSRETIMKEKVITCPVCGGNQYNNVVSTVDYSTTKESFDVVQCSACTHLYTSPRIIETSIAPYYDNPNYISHTNDQATFFSKVYQQLRKLNLSRKTSYVTSVTPRESRVLDYGCGTGQFLEALSTNYFRPEGVEINPAAREKASKFGKVHASIETVKPGVQTISMWHVMEHVYDPKTLLNEFKSRLNPGGHILIAVPNPESHDAKHYGKHWAAWDVPIHVHHFTKQSMVKMMEDAGFQHLSITPMNMDSYYISLLSEQYKSASESKSTKNWLNAVLQGFKSNYKAKKDNTSSLIYRFKLN